MEQRLRDRVRSLLGRGRDAEPLVKVAGVPSKQEAATCLETLQRQGVRAQVRQEADTGGYELWAPASQEPQARLLLGLSGHSVIRLPRQRPAAKGKR